MKASDILREAAKILQLNSKQACINRFGCCLAIDRAGRSFRLKSYIDNPGELEPQYKNHKKIDAAELRASKALERYIRPKDKPMYWFNVDHQHVFSNTCQQHRIMSLLLVADILESEGN